MNKIWKLNESNFSFFDKLNVCKFFLSNKNFWTMGDNVEEFELQMSKFIGCKYSLFVSSGSTANTILAYYLKDNTPKCKNKIILPSTTWITSVSPFIREGFEPVFVDISLKDFSLDLDKVEKILKTDKARIACVFVTSLLGFTPDLKKLKYIEKKYKVKIMLDNCENTFGEYNGKNISNYFTSTTSTYFGHQIQSVEGGFIFTNCEKEFELFSMYRNHGMIRSLKNNEKYKNNQVDPKFDFYLLGNNFRNTNINALIGSIDLKKASKHKSSRISLYNYFTDLTSDSSIKKIQSRDNITDVPFCIPLIFNNKKNKITFENYCQDNQIETRPIISGNLLRQTCLKEYGKHQHFKNSEFIHNNGFYIGLHSKISKQQIQKLALEINKLK